MSPPPCHGGIDSSSDSRPYSTPMPVGPSILCAGEAVEIAIERLHVDDAVRHGLRAVEQHRNAVLPCATAMNFSTGTIVPSAFETCASASSCVRGPISFSNAAKSTSPVCDDRNHLEHARRSARRPAATARCSRGARARRSGSRRPAAVAAARKLCATRLIASVVPRTKTISFVVARVDEARAIVSRAPS